MIGLCIRCLRLYFVFAPKGSTKSNYFPPPSFPNRLSHASLPGHHHPRIRCRTLSAGFFCAEPLLPQPRASCAIGGLPLNLLELQRTGGKT